MTKARINADDVDALAAVNGKITATIANSSTPMTARRRYAITGTGPAVLPTMSSVDDFVIVEYQTAGGVTSTVGRNGQTIDGSATDDVYLGTGSQGPVIRYDYAGLGAVTSRMIEGIPA